MSYRFLPTNLRIFARSAGCRTDFRALGAVGGLRSSSEAVAAGSGHAKSPFLFAV